MREVVIVSAVRTPIGSFNGVFKNVSAVELGIAAVKGALSAINLDPSLVEEVIIGNVLSSGLGQNVARQIAMGANIPIEVPSFSVNKVCGSGLKAITLGAQAILANEADIVVCGGTENMTQAPYILEKHRDGARMGDTRVIDSMVYDGLTDVFSKRHMGVTAEHVAKRYNISREAQDEFALGSQMKAKKAIISGRFKDEIVAVQVKNKRETMMVDTDEYPRFESTLEKLGKLRPAFEENGTVTAGNSSGINDGAAALVLMSKEKADALGVPVLARYVGGASTGVDPDIMGTGPILATKKALQRAGWSIDSLDVVEANEAFASQSLAVLEELKLDVKRVNVNGGAIALGHPIGASGARIVVTLVHEMRKQKLKRGLATLCIGGGQGMAVLFENNPE